MFIEVQLLYNIVLASTVQQNEQQNVQQNEPATHTHISLLFGFSSHLGHCRALSRVPCASQ